MLEFMDKAMYNYLYKIIEQGVGRMFEDAVRFSLDKIRKNADDFSDAFLSDESHGYVYSRNTECVGWTEGFWTGMLWLAYEFTGDEKFKLAAHELDKLLCRRIYEKRGTDTHDLGFLYTLSCVAEYKITGNEHAKNAALEAAELLIGRFHEKGQFIQAWGSLEDKDNYRLIIDCFMNLPLLFWASEETGDIKYADIAKKHFYTAAGCVIREDFTTYHTYYFDPDTGEKLKGVTKQGYSNDSCWARGQAWGIYGTALAYKYIGDENIEELFNGITECFFGHLPEDGIPYWDMIFIEGNEPRDTSAAAIAVCGMLEMNRYIKSQKNMDRCIKIMQALEDRYLTDNKSNGILKEGMYSKPDGSKSECNVWGDYFYLEALMRFNDPDWKMYW